MQFLFDTLAPKYLNFAIIRSYPDKHNKIKVIYHKQLSKRKKEARRIVYA
jgi:hypothetical protein